VSMAEFLDFARHPGHLYVVATLLPLASFGVLLLIGGLRAYLRSWRHTPLGEGLYRALGGEAPGRAAAYLATAAIALAFVCSVIGYVRYAQEAAAVHDQSEGLARQQAEEELAERWSGEWTWARLTPAGAGSGLATALHLGYAIDHLAGLMFLMVTFVATLIHIFSIGYMSDELAPEVEDHEVHTSAGPLRRRGRFPRFFLFLSLFCFSMLNLILASNLFQVFISWELVGLCSYLLIGYYYERTSASNAANKAFIINRIGDAGFLIGLAIIWSSVGTFQFREISQRLRAPAQDAAGRPVALAGRLVRVTEVGRDGQGNRRVQLTADGSEVLLFPTVLANAEQVAPQAPQQGQVVPQELRLPAQPGPQDFRTMPYWLLVAAGLGIFLGCVGKSAQFPLHVWLPDAMEGPTPVSALIHAATMVAAGVYLVGRAFPLFAPETLLVVAYTGALTLFVAATIALVMTDIKKVLAYSTVSQLGYMMLALGIGGWVAGLFHLLTHAFFKALLFLGSGSVIYGCHHVQDMQRMGGLYGRMRVTALTMLVGCLAIAGTPFFSGYYSKDAILAQALGYAVVYREHLLLFLLPLVTAGLTTFYMFRMWFLTFTGPPRDAEVYEHAQESPAVMTVPLVLLALCSIGVAWGWPPWEPEQSWLEQQLHHAEPHSVLADFGGMVRYGELFEGPGVRAQAAAQHGTAGALALGAAVIGFVLAWVLYYRRALEPAEAQEQMPGLYRFLVHKWWFDELYSAAVVRPGLVVAAACRWFDTRVIDGLIHLVARVTVALSAWDGRFDLGIVDGVVNLVGWVCWGLGLVFRRVQTGYLRSYVLFLVLAAVGIWIILYLVLAAPAAGQ
jgi:NADH-quinone oxidoreductase subunit L